MRDKNLTKGLFFIIGAMGIALAISIWLLYQATFDLTLPPPKQYVEPPKLTAIDKLTVTSFMAKPDDVEKKIHVEKIGDTNVLHSGALAFCFSVSRRLHAATNLNPTFWQPAGGEATASGFTVTRKGDYSHSEQWQALTVAWFKHLINSKWHYGAMVTNFKKLHFKQEFEIKIKEAKLGGGKVTVKISGKVKVVDGSPSKNKFVVVPAFEPKPDSLSGPLSDFTSMVILTGHDGGKPKSTFVELTSAQLKSLSTGSSAEVSIEISTSNAGAKPYSINLFAWGARVQMVKIEGEDVWTTKSVYLNHDFNQVSTP